MTDELDNIDTFIDFDAAAPVPTLRIDIRSRAGLRKLRELMMDLSRGARTEVRFNHLSNVRFLERVTLVARLRPAQRGRSLRAAKFVAAQRTRGAQPVIVWSASSARWDEAAGLVEGLARRGGHQYFNESRSDDVEIVVAFLER